VRFLHWSGAAQGVVPCSQRGGQVSAGRALRGAGWPGDSLTAKNPFL